MKTNGRLYIFSGLPASGKSTLASRLASHLGAVYLRVDTIEASLRDGTEDENLGIKCYRVAQYLAKENLTLRNTVVADCVNPVKASRSGWNEAANSAAADFWNIQVVCSDPIEHQTRLKNRGRTFAELTEPTWQEIQERVYEPWGEAERICIETSGKTSGESFRELLEMLGLNCSVSDPRS